MKALINVIGIVFLILAVCTLLLLYINEYKVYAVISESMEPTIPKGSLIVNKEKLFKEIEEKEIITYETINSDIYITHRVQDIDALNQSFICKGDANEVSDPNSVSYTMQYDSSVQYYIPYIGYIVYYLNTSIGEVFAALFIIVMIGYLIYTRR